MSIGFFVTGTDTNVGKTLVSCSLIHAFAKTRRSVVGMKPIAAGCENGRWLDVDQLSAASTRQFDRAMINSYHLLAPVAPQIAANYEAVDIDIAVIQQAFHIVQKAVDIVIVEGVGGFVVPLTSQTDTSDLAVALNLPVVMVVGLRLGCLNHALLTAEAIRARRLPLVGWVANTIDPRMDDIAENIEVLRRRLVSPLIGILPYNPHIDASVSANLLDINPLLM
ncbi:MAG: dethiobiotin synthase [Nitrosomonas sp.]|nr:MAG: dethiobiotin synthase [Nitrosomonas sp.]